MNQTKTLTISVSQMADLLKQIKGARPLTISALTDTRARKTGNPYAEVLKLTHINGFVGVDYAASVERQQTKDGQPVGFEAKRHAWGDKVCSALRQHRTNGKLYLTMQPRKVLDKQVFFGRNPSSGALVQVPKARIASFLPEKRSAAPSQGVEHEVITRDYSLDNITAITLDGQAYRVRPDTHKEKVGRAVKTLVRAVVGQTPKRPMDAAQVYDEASREMSRYPEGWDGHKP